MFIYSVFCPNKVTYKGSVSLNQTYSQGERFPDDIKGAFLYTKLIYKERVSLTQTRL